MRGSCKLSEVQRVQAPNSKSGQEGLQRLQTSKRNTTQAGCEIGREPDRKLHHLRLQPGNRTSSRPIFCRSSRRRVLTRLTAKMEFNIEYADHISTFSRCHGLPDDDSDLPVLFPYPRIYPGRFFLFDSVYPVLMLMSCQSNMRRPEPNRASAGLLD